MLCFVNCCVVAVIVVFLRHSLALATATPSLRRATLFRTVPSFISIETIFFFFRRLIVEERNGTKCLLLTTFLLVVAHKNIETILYCVAVALFRSLFRACFHSSSTLGADACCGSLAQQFLFSSNSFVFIYLFRLI